MRNVGFKFVGVNVAAEFADGEVWVYWISYRRMKTTDGWGPLQHWGVGGRYRMLKENIDK